jgi:hypothetical protein
LTERKQGDVVRRADKAPMATAWDYAPAPESRDIVRIQERYGLFIGGKFHGITCAATPSGRGSRLGNAYSSLSAQPA